MNKDYPFFPFSETICPCGKCDGGAMHPDFMARLIQLRAEFGEPMIITSGYRCPEHNREVAHTGAAGPHTTGRAVDVLIHGKAAYTLLGLAIERGMTGVGVKQTGPHKGRILHLDDLDLLTRPWVWSY